MRKEDIFNEWSKKMASSVPLESDEQQAVVQYLEIKGIKHSSIPNSTFTKSWKQKAKNKREGLKPGLPDLLMIINNRLIFIEMKRIKGGVVSKVQKEWKDAINECRGVNSFICKGFDEAKKIIDKYLCKK